MPDRRPGRRALHRRLSSRSGDRRDRGLLPRRARGRDRSAQRGRRPLDRVPDPQGAECRPPARPRPHRCPSRHLAAVHGLAPSPRSPVPARGRGERDRSEAHDSDRYSRRAEHQRRLGLLARRGDAGRLHGGAARPGGGRRGGGGPPGRGRSADLRDLRRRQPRSGLRSWHRHPGSGRALDPRGAGSSFGGSPDSISWAGTWSKSPPRTTRAGSPPWPARRCCSSSSASLPTGHRAAPARHRACDPLRPSADRRPGFRADRDWRPRARALS
jgi:hypothetical protein